MSASVASDPTPPAFAPGSGVTGAVENDAKAPSRPFSRELERGDSRRTPPGPPSLEYDARGPAWVSFRHSATSGISLLARPFGFSTWTAWTPAGGAGFSVMFTAGAPPPPVPSAMLHAEQTAPSIRTFADAST